MSKSNKSINNDKLVKIIKTLAKNNKLEHVTNVIDKVSIKEFEQVREIVPIEKWISDQYYCGRDCVEKLYPFWKDLICDIFKDGKQNYTQIVLTGGIGCRPINTTYYETSAGLLKLSEIQNLLDENVKVFINTEVGSEQIIATHNVGYKDTITLTLNDGTIFTGSSDHLLKVFDGTTIRFKKLSDITENDKILKSNSIKVSYDNDYTIDEAYVTGSILGDGCISQPNYIQFIWDDKLDGADDIENTFIKVFQSSNVHHYIKNNKWYYRNIRSSNAQLVKRLFNSITANSYTKSIPSWVFCSNTEVKWQFIAGLFDTDGHFSKKGNINITLASKDLIYQLKWLLSSVGIESTVHSKQVKYKSSYKTYYNLLIINIRSKQRFKDNCPLKWKYKLERLKNINCDYNSNCRTILPNVSAYMRTLLHLVIPRKLDSLKVYRRSSQEITFETLCKYKEHFSNWFNESDVLTYIYNHECSFITVKSKSYSHDLVGDIEVAGSHTYISDGGLINHNTGKSTCGLYIVLRKLYELSCYENVAGLFGLMSNSMTAFLYFSLTKYQAERSGFAQLRSIVDNIPYFKEYFKRNQYRNSTLDFPENIRIFYGSSTGDMIGLNCISAIIDEANFFGDSSGSEVDLGSVEELYNAVLSRTSSRFTSNGVNNSLNLVISSSTFKTSMTSKLYEKSLTDHSIKYARARLWDIKPKGTYSDETFFVFAGNDKFDPFIIESTSDLSVKLGISLDPSLSIKEAIARLSQEYRNLIDEVPIDFYPNYSNNVIQGLQDFSGMSVASTGKLFSSRSVFESCIDENIKPLFTKHEFTVETMNDDPSNCIQYYLNGIEFPHKECPRYLHIDIGVSNDAYGLACCYKNGSKLVDGVEVPEFYYDFTLRIVPPPAPKRVSISRCHEFIKYMRDELGLTIGLVSFDQFQSESSRQYLNEQNIKTVYQSVDKTDTQYLFFVDCLYKNCVHFSREFADSIHKELFDLIWFRSRHKVDHPSGGTAKGFNKDQMDGIVGALYNAYTTKETFSNPNDILNLSLFNSEDYNYLLNINNDENLLDSDLNGIKFISSKDLL